MQLRAGLVKIVCGVSLLASLCLPAQAVSPTNDRLLCAAYMDVVLEDMTPLGLVPAEQFKFMFTDRLVKLSSLTLADKEAPSDVITAFVDARNKIRRETLAAAGVNAMRLYSFSQVDAYGVSLFENAKTHCVEANKSLTKLMEVYTTEDFVKELSVISDEMKRQGEK